MPDALKTSGSTARRRSSPWTPPPGRALIDAYGADRVLFGTDYPMWDPQHELARLRGMRLAPETERKILYDNAAALFGLEGEN